ncbi:MAG: hypothetical protein KDD78_07865 [Caldilineaceae bacterium]|nr:hypothetical protein [Caldilineaceae bacterium]
MSTTAESPVKGSWEALLQEAQRLATNQNDAAIPLYVKLVTRLQKMSKIQRYAADKRLQNIYMQAAIDLHSYYNMRERYDEALALLEQIKDEVDQSEREQWELHGISLLKLAGRPDEAIAKLQRMAELPNSDLTTWGDLLITLVQLGRPEQTDAVLAKMDAWLAEQHEDMTTPGAQRDAGYVASLRSMVALEVGDTAAALDWLDQAIALDPEFKNRIPQTYIRMIALGNYEPALQLMRRDKQAPLRTDFWQAFIYFHQDEKEKAKLIWERVARQDLGDEPAAGLMEQLLSRFYLGDPEGKGLSTLLSILNEDTSQYWGVYMLTALGWAMRGNQRNAASNLETAMMQRRANGEGRLLPAESWRYFVDLVSPELQQELARFFEPTADLQAADETPAPVAEAEPSPSAEAASPVGDAEADA